MARRSESGFRDAMIDNIGEAAFACDKNGEIKIFNSDAAELFGFQKQEASGKKIWDIIKYPNLANIILNPARSKTPSKLEKVVLIEQKPFLIKIFSVCDRNGKVAGAAAIMRDLGEYARIEKALSNYVGNLSHELKAPLTAIKGYVETLLEGSYTANPEISRKFLQIINDETNRMAKLIVSLIDRKSGSASKPISSINPAVPLKAAIDLFRGVAAQKNITLETNIDENTPCIDANEESLRQIFVNILDNAVKFTGIKLGGTIKTACFPDGKNIRITISDTGIGIPQKHIPYIFNEFYRVNEGEAASLGGTGIGLSITKKLVEEISGTIEISGEEGEGAKVRITFPASAINRR